MAYYTSHIYAQPKGELLVYLKAHPLLSPGLYRLHKSLLGGVKDIRRCPKEGLVVIREVCDPTEKSEEADSHQFYHAPIVSWLELHGPSDLPVIPPPPIPTLAFGEIYRNHKTNLAPPFGFLCFLKYMSITYETLIAFYHHYTAYEDRLADAEYAWVFAEQDILYVRHVGEPYRTVQYTVDGQSTVTHSEYTKDQPILYEVMRRFGLTLSPPAYRPYFYSLKWDKYKAR